jgi:hypothetical protein
MQDTTDAAQFALSCAEAKNYPINLIQPEAYDHSLQTYLTLLIEQEERIFNAEENSHVTLRDFIESTKG